jgi:class 3 adenylate cyclase
LIFINEIAEIVHNTVALHSGVGNKNIGDAFLLVWRFSEEDVTTDPYTRLMVPYINENTRALTELAILSVIRLQPALARSGKLKKYRQNREMLERFKVDDYRVSVGVGLHLGWAIEGAIGSKYKIDASYLSSNVTIAAKLELATRHYGINLLFSEEVREAAGEGMKNMMRQIDNVKFKGIDAEVPIYTIDTEVSPYFYSNTAEIELLTSLQRKIERRDARISKDKLLVQVTDDPNYVKNLMLKDQELQLMRKKFTNEFFREWQAGFSSYSKGEWGLAKKKFEKTLHMIPDREDKPSRALLTFMEELNYTPPQEWNGVRLLN